MDRSLPADLNAERALLGSCLLEREAILVIRPLVSVVDFYLEKHAWIYEAMLDCVERRVPPDLTTVSNELQRRERLHLIGGLAYLGDLIVEVPTAVHASYYAEIVARSARQRRIIELGGKLSAAGYDQQVNPEDLIREFMVQLDLERRTVEGAEAWQLDAQDGRAIWSQSFEVIPPIIEQILPPGTFLLAGKAKTRKSWLAANYAYAVACGGRALGAFAAMRGDVLYIDLEMGVDLVHERLHVLYPQEAPPKGVTFVHTWPRIGEGFEDWFVNYMQANPYTRLIIVDTFGQVAPDPPPHITQYLHEKRLLQRVTDLVHQYRDLALLLVHHARKMSSPDAIDDASGSSGLTGGVDNVGVLKRNPKNQKTGGILTLQGRRIRLDEDLYLKWDAMLAQWNHAPEMEYTQLSPERLAVLNILRSTPGLFPKQIAERLSRPAKSIQRLLIDMLKDKQVYNMQGMYYTSEDDDPEEPLSPITA